MEVHNRKPQAIQEVYKAATAATSTQYALTRSLQKPTRLNKTQIPETANTAMCYKPRCSSHIGTAAECKNNLNISQRNPQNNQPKLSPHSASNAA